MLKKLGNKYKLYSYLAASYFTNWFTFLCFLFCVTCSKNNVKQILSIRLIEYVKTDCCAIIMDSSRTPDRETTPDIHHYIADKLNGAIFSGWYTERIWIDDLKHYRDHIKIDEDEVQTNKILRSVSRRVRKLRPKFTGIEGKPILILQ